MLKSNGIRASGIRRPDQRRPRAGTLIGLMAGAEQTTQGGDVVVRGGLRQRRVGRLRAGSSQQRYDESKPEHEAVHDNPRAVA